MIIYIQVSSFKTKNMTIVNAQIRATILKRILAITAKVPRYRSHLEALEATGHALTCDLKVVEEMPQKTEEKVEVEFFQLPYLPSARELEKEYELRNLEPDPIAQAAINEADRSFAEKHPNATQWKNAQGTYCYAIFFSPKKARVDKFDTRSPQWEEHYWFSGIRKKR